jgi:hypothetical protein
MNSGVTWPEAFMYVGIAASCAVAVWAWCKYVIKF